MEGTPKFAKFVSSSSTHGQEYLSPRVLMDKFSLFTASELLALLMQTVVAYCRHAHLNLPVTVGLNWRSGLDHVEVKWEAIP